MSICTLSECVNMYIIIIADPAILHLLASHYNLLQCIISVITSSNFIYLLGHRGCECLNDSLCNASIIPAVPFMLIQFSGMPAVIS